MYDDDAPEGTDTGVDTLADGIPRFEIEMRQGKGSAEFKHPDDLTGRDIRELREGAGSSDNHGKATNAFFEKALIILVEKWEVPGKPDMPIPKSDGGKCLNSVPGRFMRGLEQHIEPHLEFFKNTKAKGDPS